MIEILTNTLFMGNGFMLIPFIFLYLAIREYKIAKKEQDTKNEHYQTNIIKLLIIIIVIAFGINTYKYVNKDFDPDNIKLNFNTNSSTFYAIGYDERFEKAELIFNNDMDEDGMTIYIYSLPKHIWDEFRNSSSLGEYYNKNIKGKYKCYDYYVSNYGPDLDELE